MSSIPIDLTPPCNEATDLAISKFRDALDELRADQPNLAAVLTSAQRYFERAEKAEADLSRVRAANLFLAEHLNRAGAPCPDDGAHFDPDGACREKIAEGRCSECFAEAARKSVED